MLLTGTLSDKVHHMGCSDLDLYMPQPQTRLREAHKGGPGWCLPNRSCMALLVERIRRLPQGVPGL